MRVHTILAALVAGLAISPALVPATAGADVQTATEQASEPGGLGYLQAAADTGSGVLTLTLRWPLGVPSAPASDNLIFVSVAAPDGCRWIGDGVTPGDAAIVLAGGVGASGSPIDGWTADAAVQEGHGFVEQAPQVTLSPDGRTITVGVSDAALRGAPLQCFAARVSADGGSGSGNSFTVGSFDGQPFAATLMDQEVAASPPVTVLGYSFQAVGGASVAQDLAVGNPPQGSNQAPPQTSGNQVILSNLGPLKTGTPGGGGSRNSPPASTASLRVAFSGAVRFSAAHPTVKWGLSCNVSCTGQTDFHASVRKHGRLYRIPALDAATRTFSLTGAGVQERFSRVYRGRLLRELRALAARHGRVRLDVYVTATDAGGKHFTAHRVLYVLASGAVKSSR